MKASFAIPFLLVLPAVNACGGSAVNVLDTDGGSGGPGGPGSGADSGGGPGGGPGKGVDAGGPAPDAGLPPVSCGSDTATSIQGTWDLVTTGSSSDQGTLTIDANTFSFSADGSSLTLSVNGGSMTLTWSDHRDELPTDPPRQVPIMATYVSSPLDVGVIPLALGGQWNIASTTVSETCIASLSSTVFNASCSHVQNTPVGAMDGTVIGQRTQAIPSIFGDLGGQWHLAGNGELGDPYEYGSHGGGNTADVTISANSFVATVAGHGYLGGSVSAKVCDGKVSGLTSKGLEFAGQRR
jgi:hypothetical protein